MAGRGCARRSIQLLIRGLEHFGSTAVPGLAAKPIIDILIAVTSLADARARFMGPLENLDYVFWPG